MKRILILAYDFPPYTSMGGQRPFGWFQFLKENGYEPTIITRHWPEKFKSKLAYNTNCGFKIDSETEKKGTLIRVPYKANMRDKLLVKYGFNKFSLLRKTLTFFQTIFQFIFFFSDNKSIIYKAALTEINNRAYHAIIATGEPFILFRYAYLLHKKFKIPWLADYRDCWSDNFEVNRKGGFDKLFYNSYIRFFEIRYVNTAKLITTAAPFFQKQLKQLFPSKSIEVIFNGYLETKKKHSKTSRKNNIFELAFAGTIYPFQPLELFLDGLLVFIRNIPSANIKVIFYGTNYIHSQKERLLSYNSELTEYIETTDRLSHDLLFSKLSESNLLLLLDNKGMISGKLYEYLTFNKKILLAGSDNGSMEQILTDTNTGIICNTPQEIANSLEEAYTEWKQTGQVKSESMNIEQYSRKEQTRKLAELLNTI